MNKRKKKCTHLQLMFIDKPITLRCAKSKQFNNFCQNLNNSKSIK